MIDHIRGLLGRVESLERELEHHRTEVPLTSGAPRCIKTLGSPNYLNAVGTGGATFALNTNEVDNDGMGATNGRITIQTPGRYLVIAFGMVYTASAAGHGAVYAVKSSGPWNGAASASAWNHFYTNAGPYAGSTAVYVDDMIAGDYITMLGITWTAGITVGFHYNGTYLGAWWLSS